MEIINFNNCFLIIRNSHIYISKKLLNISDNDLDIIDDINDYTFDNNFIYFNNNYKIGLSNEDLIEFNSKNEICEIIQYNYKILNVKRKNKFLKIWFSNGDVKIFYCKNIKIENFIVRPFNIHLTNGSTLSTDFLYNNSFSICFDNSFIPYINKITEIRVGIYLVEFENGELRLFNGIRYKKANIEIEECMYEEIYKYGKLIEY